MANGLYDKGREGFLAGDLSWRDDDIRVVLVDTALYTVNLATHEFLSSVPVGARVAVSGSLAGKTVAGGVADADNITIPAVTGASSEAIVVYKHTGADATSRLIMYADNGIGLPFTPNDGDVRITWSNSPSKIFRL